MPGYRNPKFAYVEPRGSGLGTVLAAAIIGIIGYSVYRVLEMVAEFAVAIGTATVVVAIGSATVLGVVLYRRRGLQHIDAPQWVTERLGAARIASHGALPVRPAAAVTAAPRPAIEAPAVHYHLHLHAAPAQPAIEKEN